jgi:hypothetical protein
MIKTSNVFLILFVLYATANSFLFQKIVSNL